MIVMLTETLHYIPVDLPFGERERASIFPGPCDADHIRKLVGDAIYEDAIRLGVLVPVMDT